MRPQGLATRIFLDSGNPEETREILDVLGFLDGQTTNPTLIAKNLKVQEPAEGGLKLSGKEMLFYYRDVVRAISALLPGGSVSVEVYADPSSLAQGMLVQAKDMFSWIPNAHVKFPVSREGLKAAEQAVREGLRVNMTLCFSQEQAAAVYRATKGGKQGDVFVSPFVGRLDDRGQNGMDVIANILKMFKKSDGHVEVLTASVRHMDHFLYALKLGSPIITAPFAVLKEWGKEGLPLPAGDYRYDAKDLKPIPYKEIDLSQTLHDDEIIHDLTLKGMERFSADWNALLK
jgi:transaldolase